MVQKIRNTTLAFIAFTLLLAGCSTNKSATTASPSKEEAADAAAIAHLPAMAPDALPTQHLTSNIKLVLGLDGEKNSLKGKVRIKRDEGVQISITPLGLVEAACIEFLPDKVRLINKLFRTYTEVPYSEAAAIGLSGINYGVLESIFLNRVFLPDGRPAHQGLNEFILKERSDSYKLVTKRNSAMQYAFVIEKESGNLHSCSGNSGTGENIECDYSGFTESWGIMFPSNINITFKGDISLSLNFQHSKLSNKAFTFSSRTINSSYRKQSVGDFIKSIK